MGRTQCKGSPFLLLIRFLRPLRYVNVPARCSRRSAHEPVADVRWLRLDIERVVTTGNILTNVDLSKIDEIGFADLMPGSGHGAGGWVDVAQIKVYGKSVAR